MIHVVSYHSPKQYYAFAQCNKLELPVVSLSEALRSEVDCVTFAPVERFKKRTVKPLDSEGYFRNTMRRLSLKLPEIKCTDFLEELLSLENNQSLLKDIMGITYSLSPAALQQKFMHYVSKFMCGDILFSQLNVHLAELSVSSKVQHNLHELLSSEMAEAYRAALIKYTEDSANKVAGEFGVPVYDLNYFMMKRHIINNEVDDK